jgi:hypothetical protein
MFACLRPYWGVAFSVLLVLALTFQSADAIAALNNESTPGATFDCSKVTQIPREECQALVALYNSTNGPEWSHQRGWLVTSTPCSWLGVGCSVGHVEHLDLIAFGLRGSIPPQLGNLGRLVLLDLRAGQLSGSIPGQLGNLTDLTHMYLSYNQLRGSVPWQLGNLSNLRVLDINDNPLGGPLPTSLRLLHLTRFHFNDTDLCEPLDIAFQTWLAGIGSYDYRTGIFYPNLLRTGVICSAPTPTPAPTCVPQLPSPYSVHLNAAGPAFTDTEGLSWEPDRDDAYCTAPYWGATGGQIYTTTQAIDGTTDDVLYQSERYFAGPSGYRFAVPNGQYIVALRFAEIYPYAYVGDRVFDVQAEGHIIVSELDVLARSGGLYRAYDITATVTVADGELNLDFVARPGRNAPFVNAIAVTQLAGD